MRDVPASRHTQLGEWKTGRKQRRSLRQTVHTHRASVHQAAKLVAVLLRVAGVTADLVESNGSLPPGLWLTTPAGWLPRTGISPGTLRSVIEYGLPLPFYTFNTISAAEDFPLRSHFQTAKPSLEVAATTLATFNNCNNNKQICIAVKAP